MSQWVDRIHKGSCLSGVHIPRWGHVGVLRDVFQQVATAAGHMDTVISFLSEVIGQQQGADSHESLIW